MPSLQCRPGLTWIAQLLFVTGLLALTGCSGSSEPGLEPPPSRVQETSEILHGVELRDPYRWLEDQDSPETRAWIDAQNEYTDAILHTLSGREELRDTVRQLLEIDTIEVPRENGGRYFFSTRRAGQDLSVLYFREGHYGEDQILIDPHPMSEDHTTSVGFLDISDDGRLVVYRVRQGGVDEFSIHVMDVDSHQNLKDVLPAARYGSVALTPDKTGFYYTRYGDVDPRVYYHGLGIDHTRDEALFGEGYTQQDIPICDLSDDGRWLLVHVIEGSSGPTEIYVKDLRSDSPFATVINDGESISFAGFAGTELVIVTNFDAPNKRLMVADLARPSVDHWKEIIPERADVVLEDFSAVGGKLFVSYLKDVQPRASVHQMDGTKLRDIAFGTIGSVGNGRGSWTSSEVFFAFSSFHVSPTIYRYDIETWTQEIWAEVEVPVDGESVEVRQVRYTSKDGTTIPMFVIQPRSLSLDGSNPTLLTGYGGFNVSRTPTFSAFAAAWVQSGGVYALANIRGGGEFGEEWHLAGMLENKQNVFDDFIAAAEYLISENYTRSERMAIQGGSNGGLLVGAVTNQRPNLFGAVVCTYPLLDMVRYHKFLVASFWVPEYGSSADPEQFKYLLAYSPYHNVANGANYPAMLFITGDGDTRVAPLHARKMAALLQAHSGSETPILLRYHTAAGHSGGQPVSQRIDEMMDTLSFLKWQVGD